MSAPIYNVRDGVIPAIVPSTPITAAHLDQAIADMTNAFLRWPLPESVNADGCATRQGKGRSGTNLMSVGETLTMMQEVVRPIVAQLIADSEAKAVSKQTEALLVTTQLMEMATTALEIATQERNQLKAEVERWKNSANFHRDRGITLLDAKWLDPECHKGCKSLVLKDRAERAEAELAAERARLDWLSARGFEHRHHETGDHLGYEWTISSYSEFENVTLRDVIDAAMKEGAK